MSKYKEIHSQMLGQIANEVSEYCDTPECTTLEAVKFMQVRLLELQAENVKLRILANRYTQSAQDLVEGITKVEDETNV